MDINNVNSHTYKAEIGKQISHDINRLPKMFFKSEEFLKRAEDIKIKLCNYSRYIDDLQSDYNMIDNQQYSLENILSNYNFNELYLNWKDLNYYIE